MYYDVDSGTCRVLFNGKLLKLTSNKQSNDFVI